MHFGKQKFLDANIARSEDAITSNRVSKSTSSGKLLTCCKPDSTPSKKYFRKDKLTLGWCRSDQEQYLDEGSHRYVRTLVQYSFSSSEKNKEVLPEILDRLQKFWAAPEKFMTELSNMKDDERVPRDGMRLWEISYIMRVHWRMAMGIELVQKERYSMGLKGGETGTGEKKEPSLILYLVALFGKSDLLILQKEEDFDFERQNGGI